MASKVLQILIVSLLFLNLFNFAFTVHQASNFSVPEYTETTAAASGIVSLCINAPPELIIPCDNSTEQGDPYICELNASDTAGTNFTYSGVFITNNTLFNVSIDGLISFTPDNSDIGNHTIVFTVTDDSGCVNNEGAESFTLEVNNANDPPVLSLEIPDVDFLADEVVSAFFLDNHFTDPDGDNLTYAVSGEDEAIITIANSSLVRIRSDTCDFSDVVLFTATDPGNLSATSNAVTITCTNESEPSSGAGGASGGGGGGAGGSAFACLSDFECFDYTPCISNNTKVQKCVDKNACEEEDFITVECNYVEEQKTICSEEWLCGDWGECQLNNTRQRDCLDVNRCGTFFDMPEASEACVYVPTCSDGVMNGNETGVDCGGSCQACQHIETPAAIEPQRGLFTNLLFLIVSLILLVLLVFQYYHKEAYQLLAKMGLHFAGRVPKQVILSDEDRDALLEKVRRLESHYMDENLSELTSDYVDAATSFFSLSMGLGVDSEKEDLLAICEDRKYNEHLTRVLASFFDKVKSIDLSPDNLVGYELMYLVEELKEAILQTSVYDLESMHLRAVEYAIPASMFADEKLHLRLVNTYIALHFNKVEAAVSKYMELLEFYEGLSESQEDAVYDDIARLYQKIRYRAAWIENM